MKIDHIKLPPVSQKFYDKLLEVFPPLDPLDINKKTDMIDVHRSAAQQEVLEYVRSAVRKSEDDTQPMTLVDKFRYVLTR